MLMLVFMLGTMVHNCRYKCKIHDVCQPKDGYFDPKTEYAQIHHSATCFPLT